MSRAGRLRGAARAAAAIAFVLGIDGCARSPAPAPPARTPEPGVRVIAHRGASAHAPENTLPAVARALDQGAVDVELDVRLSRDGVPALFHDEHLAEKTGAPGRVRHHDARFLRGLDVGAWFDRTHPGTRERFAGTNVATLEDAFRAFGARPFYHLELKSPDPGLVPEVLARIEAFGLADRVMLTSFDPEQLARAWKVRTPDDWRRVLELGADGGTVDWPDVALGELALRRSR